MLQTGRWFLVEVLNMDWQSRDEYRVPGVKGYPTETFIKQSLSKAASDANTLNEVNDTTIVDVNSVSELSSIQSLSITTNSKVENNTTTGLITLNLECAGDGQPLRSDSIKYLSSGSDPTYVYVPNESTTHLTDLGLLSETKNFFADTYTARVVNLPQETRELYVSSLTNYWKNLEELLEDSETLCEAPISITNINSTTEGVNVSMSANMSHCDVESFTDLIILKSDGAVLFDHYNDRDLDLPEALDLTVSVEWDTEQHDETEPDIIVI